MTTPEEIKAGRKLPVSEGGTLPEPTEPPAESETGDEPGGGGDGDGGNEDEPDGDGDGGNEDEPDGDGDGGNEDETGDGDETDPPARPPQNPEVKSARPTRRKNR